jgi:hypothetical protein
MAAGAVEPGLRYVGFVTEKDKLRDPENPYPGDRFSRIQVGLLFPDFRMVRYDILVAEEALFYGGQAGILRPADIRVAEAAVDLLHPRVDPVAERDGLAGAHREGRIGPVQKAHEGDQDPGEGYP